MVDRTAGRGISFQFGVGGKGSLTLAFELLGHALGGGNAVEELALLGSQVFLEAGIPFDDSLNGDLVEHTVDTGKDQGDLNFGGNGRVLLLLEQFGETGTSGEQVSGGSVQVGTELGERGDFSVLGQVELQGTGDGLHDLGLGGGTDSRDGKTDVDSGSDTLEEQFGFQEDLSVGDGNDVGGNVGRDITTLGLDDGQGGQGTTTELLVHLGGSLEQSRVQVENVTGVGLSSGS